MKKICLLSVFILCVSFTLFAGQYDDIPLEKIMSPEQQAKVGVKKLSPAEKEELRIFIIDTFMKGFDAGKTEGVKLALRANSAPSVIESQIDGNFEGWEGETVVKLMNGQIWQQTEYYYTYHYAFMPKVLIYKSGGGYKMQVEGVSRAVGVMQLR